MLLLHGVKTWKPGFESVIDQEFSFPRYDKANDYVCQSWHLPVTNFVKKTTFDAVIVSSTFMDAVALSDPRSAWFRQYDFLKSSRHVKIAFPQDDYWFVEERDFFYTKYEFDAVFPICPQPSWNELIPAYIRGGGSTFQGQTAYVTPHILSLRYRVKNPEERAFDVVYRATRFPNVPNEIGDRKGELGSLFMDSLGPSGGLRLDLGIEQSDFLLGPDWYGFLANSRSTLGANSGSSVLLRSQEMFRKALRIVEENPQMSRRELTSRIFPSKDRNKNYTALAPRNLEAAALGVLQLLTPGDYGGLMEKGLDYFELQHDCSNASDAVDLVRDTRRSTLITDSAYATLIENPDLAFGSHMVAVTELIRQHMRRGTGTRQVSETFYWTRLMSHRWGMVFFTNVEAMSDYWQTTLEVLKSKLRNRVALTRAMKKTLRFFRRSRRGPR